MTSVWEVHSVGSALSFCAWSLAVIALGKALFRSFWAEEMKLWLVRRHQRRTEEMRQAAWELQHGMRYSVALVKGDPHAARTPLSSDEAEKLRISLDRNAWRTIWFRAIMSFLSCPFCHGFWAAVILLCAVRGLKSGPSVIADAFAYAALNALAVTFVFDAPAARRPHNAQLRPCPSCGSRPSS